MNEVVEAVEVSPGGRRIATGVMRDVEVAEGDALRPLARALIDLALALTESDGEETGT